MAFTALVEYKGRNAKPCQLRLNLLLQDNVKEVKAKIHMALSVPTSLIRLFCGNMELQEEETLLKYYSYTQQDPVGSRSLRLQLIM